MFMWGEFAFLVALAKRWKDYVTTKDVVNVCVCAASKEKQKKPANQAKKSLKKYFQRTNTGMREREKEKEYVCASLFDVILFFF